MEGTFKKACMQAIGQFQKGLVVHIIFEKMAVDKLYTFKMLKINDFKNA